MARQTAHEQAELAPLSVGLACWPTCPIFTFPMVAAAARARIYCRPGSCAADMILWDADLRRAA